MCDDASSERESERGLISLRLLETMKDETRLRETYGNLRRPTVVGLFQLHGCLCRSRLVSYVRDHARPIETLSVLTGNEL
ncbi:hypothetical protein C8Q76DRAFT_233461 [Earliella scabrosa]|nr:hypothetical protein C8Q76DRAFT_233461 [Earliella scabrosa]